MNKLYRTKVEVIVLSREPLRPDMDLRSIDWEITDGECVGDVHQYPSREISIATMREALRQAGSDPHFFDPI